MKPLLWIPALLCAALAYAVWDGEAGLRPWLRVGADLRETRARIVEIRAENGRLEREAAGLRSDPLAIERAIREDLEFARSGEVVVRLPPADPSNARNP